MAKLIELVASGNLVFTKDRKLVSVSPIGTPTYLDFFSDGTVRSGFSSCPQGADAYIKGEFNVARRIIEEGVEIVRFPVQYYRINGVQ